jgi:nitrogenase molybdenum-iron protein beta chain
MTSSPATRCSGDDDYKVVAEEQAGSVRRAPPPEKVQEVFLWTTSKEYQDLNFKREALTVDPAKACQPLGAVLCALGFEKTLPYVHGSQGCVSYFRTYFNRHFKEPICCVSDSMTEDAAVFGGQKNMFDGLENAKAIYKPEMIAVSTTCMAEVIGDDLNAFINNAKKEGYVPDEFPVPFAHTPSFVGSHVTGWDNMFEGIMRSFTLNTWPTRRRQERQAQLRSRLRDLPGQLPRHQADDGRDGVDATLLSDPTEVLDTPADGEFRMYAGGTTQAEIKDAPNAISTILLQPYQLDKTKKLVENTWNHEVPKLNIPMGVDWTDEFLMKVSELTGKPIPESLAKERGRLVDMMSDSHAWLHGKKFALYGDPDFVMGMVKILFECGAEPTHVVSHNGTKRWLKAMEKMLAESPFGGQCQGLHRPRPVAPAFAVLHRQAGFPDRQQLRQVHPARHPAQGQGLRSAADPHRLPALRSSSPASPDDDRLRGGHAGGHHAGQCGARTSRPRNHGHGHHRLQLRPGALKAHRSARRGRFAVPAQPRREVHGQHHGPQDGVGAYSFYLPKRDLEDAIVSMEFDSADKWGGEIRLNNGGAYYIEPQALPARFPISLRARRLDAAE